MLTSDRVQAWSEFLRWWQETASLEWKGSKDTAGRAWLAACEWAWSVRGDE